MASKGSKFALVLSLLCFLAVGIVWGEGPADVRALNGILDAFETAYIDEDVDMLDGILSENYVMVAGGRDDPRNARVMGKKQLLSGIEHMFSQVEYRTHRHTDRAFEFHGAVAELNSVLTSEMAGGTKNVQNSYHICARENGEWKVVFTSFLMAE